MNLDYRHQLIIVFLFLFLMPLTSHAEGLSQLGERCNYTHECGQNMGCRKSEIKDFSVCKIAAPNVAGCGIDIGENPCADGMACRKDRCKLTFGFDDTSATTEKDQQWFNLGKIWKFPDLHQIFSINFKGLLVKILNFCLAITILVGLTMIAKGLLIYRTATGYIPQQRHGLYIFGWGCGFFVAAILIWFLLT